MTDTRRVFIRKVFGGAAIASLVNSNLFAQANSHWLVDNPYEDVNWNKFKHVPSTSHMHITDREMLDKAYHDFKLKHLPISNYYPSTPYYPIENIRENQFKVKQEFGTMYNANKPDEAKYISGPLYWSQIIMDHKNGWYDKLTPEQKQEMPFKEGRFMFKNLPKDLIISPNAEHHSFTNTKLHANSLGSLYSSGTFDITSKFLSRQHGYSIRTGQSWEIVFAAVLEKLLFADAGGITINHPVWSKLDIEEVYRMLDFDKRVLGIEVFNDTCVADFGDPLRGWAIKMWDKILTSGRRYLGFFVPDHTFGKGKNILLVKNFTKHECLKAYRKGVFYGSGLHFTNITLDENNLIVETSKKATMRFITNKGEVLKERETTKMQYKIPLNKQVLPDIKYIRVEANDDISEQIYSQPIRFLSVN